MAQPNGQRNRAPEQIAVAPTDPEYSCLVGSDPQRPDDPSLKPVRTSILSARAWRLISARHASTSSTSWITWPSASNCP
jgi:hypothetical protein